jgi:ABC-type antimicrobial peptide transport system permease subunit
LSTPSCCGRFRDSVAQRRREFGIRLALGATRDRIVRTVLLQGATIGFIGVGVGLAAALVFMRALQDFVYGVSTLDPATFAAVSCC